MIAYYLDRLKHVICTVSKMFLSKSQAQILSKNEIIKLAAKTLYALESLLIWYLQDNELPVNDPVTIKKVQLLR